MAVAGREVNMAGVGGVEWSGSVKVLVVDVRRGMEVGVTRLRMWTVVATGLCV